MPKAIQIIRADSLEQLQDLVNNWLEENDHYDIHSTSLSISDSSGLIAYSILHTPKEKKQPSRIKIANSH